MSITSRVLIIWDGGRQLDAFRLECIRRVKEVYPDVKLSCITKDADLLPEIIDEHVMWDFAEKKLWEKWFVKSKEAKTLSDYFRYLWLSENPHTLYIDTDIYLHEKIEETGYMAKWRDDYSAIWNGECCNFFNELVKRRTSNGNLAHLLSFYPHDCGDLGRFMTHQTKERKQL